MENAATVTTANFLMIHLEWNSVMLTSSEAGVDGKKIVLGNMIRQQGLRIKISTVHMGDLKRTVIQRKKGLMRAIAKLNLRYLKIS